MFHISSASLDILKFVDPIFSNFISGCENGGWGKVEKIRQIITVCSGYFRFISKWRFFSNVQIWRLIFLNPVGVQRCTIPHFKGLIKTFKMRYCLCTLTGWSATSILLLKRMFFSNVQIWRLVSLDPVEVQRRTVSHFKGLIKTFKMRYSMFLYSDGIMFKFRFQKSHFTPKNRNRLDIFLSHCILKTFFCM